MYVWGLIYFYGIAITSATFFSISLSIFIRVNRYFPLLKLFDLKIGRVALVIPEISFH